MRQAAAALLLAGCTQLDIFEVGEAWMIPRAEDDLPRWSAPGYTARSRLDDGRWTIESTLPRGPAACGDAEICADADRDGLVDAWEAMLLDRVRPIVRIGAEEDLLFDPGAIVGSVGRVWPRDGAIAVVIVLAYSRDYGHCGFTEHHGDSERVAVLLRGIDDQTVEVAATYTAAHEGTSVDASEWHVPPDLAFVEDPRTLEPRWRVFAAEGKHATYRSPAACHAFADLTCLAEGCPGDTWEPWLELLLPVANAGEPGLDLHVPGGDAWPFYFSHPWDPAPFCGDRFGSDIPCARSLQEKLLADPFR